MTKQEMAAILHHLVTHSRGYPTQADRQAHLDLLEADLKQTAKAVSGNDRQA